MGNNTVSNANFAPVTRENLVWNEDWSVQGLEGKAVLLAEDKTGHKQPANPKQYRKEPLM